MSTGDDEGGLAPGTQLGNYVVGARLASGGMAEIYYAESIGRRYDRPIVLKRMHDRLAKDREFVDMFVHEARISSRLDHPNIAQVYEFGAVEAGLFLVMERIDGPDLLSVIKRCATERSRLPDELAVYVACHALEALEHAHTASYEGQPMRVVHRDVSPSNLLITRRGQVKLVDFGIARAAERQHKNASGTLRGKYGYMSPEQVLGKNLDGRSDVFSMGIVLAEMLMSRRLFASPGGEVEVLLMVRRCDLTRLDKYGGAIPDELQSILRTALEVDRDKRYPSAGAFLDALNDWLSRSPEHGHAQRLARLIDGLEKRGGPLHASGSSKTNNTLSGPDTMVARRARDQLDELGRAMFARGAAVHPGVPPSAVVGELDLGHYDGSSAPSVDSSNEISRAHAIALDNGSIEEVPPIELLCEIGQRRLEGTLVMRHGGHVNEAYFRDGHPEMVRSNSREHRFGQYLVRHGVLAEEQLARALEALPHFGGRLGQALVTLDLLKPVDAVRLLSDHLSQKLIDACTWTSGRYFFQEGAKQVTSGLALPLNTLEIVGRSLHTLPEERLLAWGKRYRERKPIIDLESARELALPLGLFESLEAMAHGERALGDVVRGVRSGAERRRLVAAAYVLWRCGILRLPRPAAPAAAAPRVVAASDRRRAPRVEVHAAATVDLLAELGGAPCPSFHATICYATADGLGLNVNGATAAELPAKAGVVVRFLAGVRQVELCGTVIWHRDGGDAEVNTGVAIDPALTDGSMQRAFTGWMNALLGTAE